MKTKRFWGYPRLGLWLIFSIAVSCKALKPAENTSPSIHANWIVEAKVMPGFGMETLVFNNGISYSMQVAIMGNNVLLPDKSFIGIVYRAENYQMAQQIREQLLATGMIQDIKISN